MKSLKTIKAIAIALSFSVFQANANGDLLIFGGSGHDLFLGCLVCNELSPDSICNGFGTYGNEFSSNGMFNEFSGFGNEFKSSSPWNEYSTSDSVPVLVDRDGKFYGYFTTNDSRHNAVEFSSNLRKMFESADGDLEKVRVMLCQSLGYSG